MRNVNKVAWGDLIAHISVDYHTNAPQLHMIVFVVVVVVVVVVLPISDSWMI